MVSIRYFWAVGEFCRVKSMPRCSLASKTGTLSETAANISRVTLPICEREFNLVPKAYNYCVGKLLTGILLPRSEKEFERELDQPRIRSLLRTGNDSEVRVVSGTANCVGRSELGAIEQVK